MLVQMFTAIRNIVLALNHPPIHRFAEILGVSSILQNVLPKIVNILYQFRSSHRDLGRSLSLSLHLSWRSGASECGDGDGILQSKRKRNASIYAINYKYYFESFFRAACNKRQLLNASKDLNANRYKLTGKDFTAAAVVPTFFVKFSGRFSSQR